MLEFDDIMDRHEANGKNPAKELNEYHDEIIFNQKSPRSTLSRHSPPLSTLSPGSNSLDLPIYGNIDLSIERLYQNVCEMQSSDQSPSRRSFLSYGEESRIDSELRFLAGGDYGIAEMKKETENERSGEEDAIVNRNEETEVRRLSLDSNISKKDASKSKRVHGRPPNGKKQSVSHVAKKFDKPSFTGVETEYLGPYLLKQARDVIASSTDRKSSEKALHLALRAMKSFEGTSVSGKPNLDYVMCLHVVAASYSRLGRYTEAIPVLERSIDIPVMDLGHNHALAKFAGCMQLGDTYAMLEQIENSILFYSAGLEIQRQVLGENDPRVGETLRYLAETHVQAMRFDEAEKLCLMALDIHIENVKSASPEEAADRRLLGLICDYKGDYEAALEHYVLASMALSENGQSAEVASIDCSIGDAYLSMSRYDEAVFAYQKSLNTFKSCKGENHYLVASVLVRLADLYNKIGKFGESKSHCENALRIYASKPLAETPPEEIASGLVDISAIFESANEHERALQLLKRAVKAYGDAPGQRGVIAGIEAQMGVLYYIIGDYHESYRYLKSATVKMRSTSEKKSALFGVALNQMGLACVRLMLINEAADAFEEARAILEAECGPFHADTLGVYSNLAGTYDAMGRTGDAIEILEYVVEMREEKLGTANPEVEDEKRRLSELLHESGMVRNRRSKPLGTLFVKEL